MFWLKPDFPFHPKKVNFYYGWVILCVAIFASISSIPGQTAGFSPFTEPLLEKLGLTRTQLSSCYFMGTLLSSFLLTKAGRLIDRYGVRLLLVLNAILFGSHLIFMSYLPGLLSRLFSNSDQFKLIFSMVFLTIGVLFLRFLGQGTLPLMSSTMIGKWFSGKRGKASAMSSIAVGLAFSAAPSVMNELVLAFGYRMAWLSCAMVMFLCLLPFAVILCRDTPEKCGLKVEGQEDVKSDEEVEIDGVPLVEAKKTVIFWAMVLPLAIHAMVFTGFTFHLLGISTELNLNSRTTMAIFLPISMISLPLGFFFSRWSDSHSMKPLIYLMAIAQMIGYGGSIFIATKFGFVVAIIGYGLTSAVFSPIFGVGMAKYFGRKYLGEIQGKLSSILVMSSSVGPLILSLLRDVFDSFQPGLILFSLCPLSVLVLLLWGKDKLN